MRCSRGLLSSLCALVCAAGLWAGVSPVRAAADENAYFNMLVARADHWKSNSLRSQALIDQVTTGVRPNPWVTFDATFDAAKTVIPAFVDQGYKVASVGPDWITFAAPLTAAEQNRFMWDRGLLVGEEIMTVVVPAVRDWGSQFPDASTVRVVRGQFGTAQAAHAADTSIKLSANSLPNYLEIPLGTSDQPRYVFTWDVYYTTSYVGTDNSSLGVGHKEFRFNGPRRNQAWFQIDLRNDGVDGFGTNATNRATEVGTVSGLAISMPSGTNLTSQQPIKPQLNRFIVKPNRWIRYWVVVEQPASGFDQVSMWVADSATPPVKVFDRLLLDVQGAPASIATWWLEQNSSYDLFRGSRRDLVSYVRNFVALVNPPDVSALLVSPSGAARTPEPSPPTTLRIIR